MTELQKEIQEITGIEVSLKRGKLKIQVEEIPFLELDKVTALIGNVLVKLQGTKFDLEKGVLNLKDLPKLFTTFSKELAPIIELSIGKPGFFKENKIGISDGLKLFEAVLKVNEIEELTKNVESLAVLIKAFL